MALSQGSVITITDINAEFDTKIDSAGTGLSKDGTSLSLASLHSAIGSAGPTANATPAYGATFTVPQINYDTYGRVTGHNNYTVKIPAASASYPITACAQTQGTNVSGNFSTALNRNMTISSRVDYRKFGLRQHNTSFWWLLDGCSCRKRN